MLSFLIKAFFAVTTTIFVGNGNAEPAAETSNSNIKPSVSVSENTTAKKDTTSSVQTPIVIFKLINTPENNKAEGKSLVKLSTLLNKFSIINNPQTDRRRSNKSKVG